MPGDRDMRPFGLRGLGVWSGWRRDLCNDVIIVNIFGVFMSV